MNRDKSWYASIKRGAESTFEAIKENKEMVAIVLMGLTITTTMVVTKPEDHVSEDKLRDIELKLNDLLDREPDWSGGEDQYFAGEEWGTRM